MVDVDDQDDEDDMDMDCGVSNVKQEKTDRADVHGHIKREPDC